MRARRTTGVAAAFLAGALALGACSSPTTNDAGSTGEASNVTVAWNQAFYSYNDQSSNGNATANSNILYMANSTFNYYDDNAELVKNTDFGTYEQVSEDPLVVKYTVNEDVTWSDGTPIDSADLLLYWAANSGSLNTPDFKPETDADGNILPSASGTEVFFDGRIGAGMENVTKVPELGDDGRSITLTYDNIFVDWELAFWATSTPGLPAHVVAKKALSIDDPQAAKDALVAAVQDGDAAALKSLADFWNTGFGFTALPDDPALYLSSGAYVIDSFEPDQFVTLVRNDKYTWGPAPSIDKVTVRFITDPNAAVTALQNGEVDIISPQPTADVRTAVDKLDKVTVESTVDATYEHVDLQFANSRNPGVFGDQRVREAFLKVLPRQEILDKLIVPLDPAATIRNSFILSPDFPGYDEMVAANGLNAFDTVDTAGAQALLAEAGVSNPEVCLLYASDNPRRVSEFQLIQASAKLAGFNVTDCGNPDWSALLGTAGAYDAALFGWQSTTTGISESKANFVSTGTNNFSFYSNPQVDALYAQLDVTTDKAAQLDLEKQIETLLVQDSFGATIFQFPGVTAFRDTVTGVTSAPLAPTIFWNFWEWQLA